MPKNHLIIAHEVTNVGHDKHQLANMARQANEVTGANGLTVLADRGYFSGEESCGLRGRGRHTDRPKPLTSGAKADGRFGKQDFIYQPETNTYRCPAEAATPRPAGSRRESAGAAAPPRPTGPARGGS
jgi:hypothetical protein